MSEQWKGLHHHDRHVTAAPLGRTIVVCELGMACREVCSEAYPCKCCLQAEVEALRDEAHLIELSCGDWKKRALAAEAQVQAVREVCDKWAAIDYNPPLPIVNDLRRILDDGGEV